MKVLSYTIAFSVCLSFVAGSARAQSAGVDPHAVYEQACYSCHTEHAADLARQRLSIKSDKLAVARTGKDLATILKSHHGVKLKAEELAALTQLFRNGITWGGVYQHRCGGCHDKAVTLARSSLKMDGDKLVISKTGSDVATFLKTHGEASTTEVDTLVAMLKYQLATAPKP